MSVTFTATFTLDEDDLRDVTQDYLETKPRSARVNFNTILQYALFDSDAGPMLEGHYVLDEPDFMTPHHKTDEPHAEFNNLETPAGTYTVLGQRENDNHVELFDGHTLGEAVAWVAGFNRNVSSEFYALSIIDPEGKWVHTHDVYDPDPRDALDVVQRAQLDSLINIAATLTSPDTRDENPEYTRGMAELIIYSMGWSGDHTDLVTEWIRTKALNERRIDTPQFIVDGHMHPNEDSDLASDGPYPPFYIFDVAKQVNLSGHYQSRVDAQHIADFLNEHVLAVNT